jgi:heme-degrading monooxygenase HmoA
MTTRYTYLWEFLVASDRIEEFKRHYGPAGTWVALFRQSPGYIETLLLQDSANPRRFITVDRWESRDAYESFESRFSREYAAIDEVCQHLTARETPLGQYGEDV